MNGDNYAALKAATLGAQQIQTPASPLGASNAAELAALHQSGFQLPQSNAATRAQSYNTDVTIANQKQAAEAEVQRLKEEAQRIADSADANKYTLQKKADGGYDFFDPEGNQVDIATYAAKTGKKPSDILKDSENPIDIQYREDYKNLQDLLTAVVNNDTEALDSYRQKAEAEGIPDITKQKPQDVIDAFKAYYKRYYVTREQDPTAWGQAPAGGITIPNQKATGAVYPGIPGGGNSLANGG